MMLKLQQSRKKSTRKKDELKKLKETLDELQEKKNKADYSDLIEYMQENGLTPSEVLGAIKN